MTGGVVLQLDGVVDAALTLVWNVGLTVILGGVAVVFCFAAVQHLRTVPGAVRRAVRVLTGPEPATTVEERAATYVAVELGDPGDDEALTLAQVHDTFGYYVLRTLAADTSGEPGSETERLPFVTNPSGGVSPTGVHEWLLDKLYSPDGYREEEGGPDRCRARVFDPSTVTARVEGRRLRLDLEDEVRPLQRLQADGTLVPWLFFYGAVLWWLGFVPTLAAAPAVLVAAAEGFVGTVLVRWLLPAEVGVTALLLLVLAVLTVYHDTALVGGWSTVLPLRSDPVPDAVAAADDTPDPDRTARVDLATAEPGVTLSILGTVEPTHDCIRVVEGVVSTRGRAFLLVASVVDAVRPLLVAGLQVAVAAGAGWLLWLLLV
jgi:hypothetical protein